MTAATLYQRCRRAGINLAADGDGITFDAPAAVEVPLDEILRIKPELLAMLRGDYLKAALVLVRRVIDPTLRDALADRFDRRVSICQYDGGMSLGEARRAAYRELARSVEAMGENLSVPPEEQGIYRDPRLHQHAPKTHGVSS